MTQQINPVPVTGATGNTGRAITGPQRNDPAHVTLRSGAKDQPDGRSVRAYRTIRRKSLPDDP